MLFADLNFPQKPLFPWAPLNNPFVKNHSFKVFSNRIRTFLKTFALAGSGSPTMRRTTIRQMTMCRHDSLPNYLHMHAFCLRWSKWWSFYHFKKNLDKTKDQSNFQ